MPQTSVPGPLTTRLAHTLQQAWLERGTLAVLLLPLAFVFGALGWLRGALYRRGMLSRQRLPVPVVVVGNLIVGGAGKTPVVLELVRLLRRRGYTPGVLSRGYGRRGGSEVLAVDAATPAAACGDEPKLLSLRSGARVVVDRDRPAAGRALLQAHSGVDVIVSDDGLQHLALERDVQVIVFDARGIGNGWLLPAGPLREPFAPQAPARSLVVYNAAAASTPWPGHCMDARLSGVAELGAWWRGEAVTPQTLAALRGRPLTAAAGIANPQRFFDMLREHDLEFTPLPLPDHWPYATLPWAAHVGDVIVTEKDAVKLDPARLGATRVWVAALDLALGAPFEAELLALLPAPRARR